MHLPEFDACPMHSALRASDIGRIKIQCACIGLFYFTRKSKIVCIYEPLIQKMYTFTSPYAKKKSKSRFSFLNTLEPG